MGKPTRTDDLNDSASTVALVAAMLTVDDALAVAAAELAKEERDCADREGHLAEGKGALQAVLDAGRGFAAAPGPRIDQSELDGHALKRAIAQNKVDLLQTALDSAVGRKQAAGVEHLKARWHVAQRDAKQALRPEGETRIAVADALDVLVKAVDATHSASLARIELDRGVLQLRDELWGVKPSARHHPYQDDQEMWRILMALPTRWIEEIRAHHTAGDVDLRAFGQSLIKRSEA